MATLVRNSRKLRFDCREQIRLIDQHRRKLTAQSGQNVDAETAAIDWITKNAAEWRRSHESKPAS